jgi:hypothetical protein
LSFPQPCSSFDYFEHRFIGNQAFDNAQEELHLKTDGVLGPDLDAVTGEPHFDKASGEHRWGLGLNRPISREPNDPIETWMVLKFLDLVPISFGDLPALAGDHAKSVEALKEILKSFADLKTFPEEHRRFLATRRQWWDACTWYHREFKPDPPVTNVKACFDGTMKKTTGLLDGESMERPPSRGYAPSRDELSEFEKLDNYVGLAGQNKTHFPRHSWQEYLSHHQKAIDNARKYVVARKNSPPGSDYRESALPYLYKALVDEGWAQHFLHDSYSAGHIGSKYGWCFPAQTFPIRFCAPTRNLLQSSHDHFNEQGMKVTIESVASLASDTDSSLPSVKASKTVPVYWLAFGDRHLFIPEADRHRSMLVHVATLSLKEVLEAATSSVVQTASAPTFQTLCRRWISRFPIPAEIRSLSETREGEMCGSAAEATGSPGDLARWEGRPVDPRLRDHKFEGWKLMGTWGTTWGAYDQLNSNGSLRHSRNSVPAGTFELGYLRPTSAWWPNYFGAGVFLAPTNHLSVYPLSVGWWKQPADFLTLGSRVNFGMKILEPFTEQNNDDRRRAFFEMSVPLDIIVPIYPPLSFYVRPELVSFAFKGLAEPGSFQHLTVGSVFAGTGSLTFGFTLDLANVL